jgi:alanine racemase
MVCPAHPPPREKHVSAELTWIEIDLGTIARNAAAIRRTVGPSVGLCAVVKADAYGMGAVRVARALAKSDVSMLAVYSLDQARELVQAGISLPILVLSPVRSLERDDRVYWAASRGLIHLTIHDADNLKAITSIAEGLGINLPVHLDLDTGMGRGGACLNDSPTGASALAARIVEHPRLRLAGVCTHWATSDTDGMHLRLQVERFERWISEMEHILPKDCTIHGSHTPGVFRGTRLHYGMVRVGIGLFGYASETFGPAERFDLGRAASDLTPSIRWATHVVHVKSVDPGWSVGYGCTWRAQRPTRLALLPVGYADGYPIALSNKGAVGIAMGDGRVALAPVVGRVSMDQMVVDVTDLPETLVAAGTEVELIGRHRGSPNGLAELAKAAGTIPHQLLTGLSARLPRRYVYSAAHPSAADTTERAATPAPAPAGVIRPAPTPTPAPSRAAARG